MEFLGNLCVCAGRPIPSTQSKTLVTLMTVNSTFYNFLCQNVNQLYHNYADTILRKLVEEQGKV